MIAVIAGLTLILTMGTAQMTNDEPAQQPMPNAAAPGSRGGPAPSNQDWNLATRPAGFISKSITVGETSYNYVVYAPREYHPQSRQRAWPTIVFLHGRGECGTDGMKQLIHGPAQRIIRDREHWPFLIIFPQKPEQGDEWEKYDNVVMAMLEATRNEYPIDPDRTYLSGLSQGGHGTLAIGANHPDVWAALVPVCGYTRWQDGKVPGRANDSPESFVPKIKNLPIWAFHGDQDETVPVAQSKAMIEALKAAARAPGVPEPKLTIYKGVGHNSWENAYSDPELPTWLLAQQRKR